MKFFFLAFKNLKKKILKIKITAIFFPVRFKNSILQIIRFTDMKVRLYAGDMHLNRKDEKKVCRNTKI